MSTGHRRRRTDPSTRVQQDGLAEGLAQPAGPHEVLGQPHLSRRYLLTGAAVLGTLWGTRRASAAGGRPGSVAGQGAGNTAGAKGAQGARPEGPAPRRPAATTSGRTRSATPGGRTSPSRSAAGVRAGSG